MLSEHENFWEQMEWKRKQLWERPPKVQNQTKHHPSPFPLFQNLCPHSHTEGEEKTPQLLILGGNLLKEQFKKGQKELFGKTFSRAACEDGQRVLLCLVSIHTNLGFICFHSHVLLSGLAVPRAVPHICWAAEARASPFAAGILPGDGSWIL